MSARANAKAVASQREEMGIVEVDTHGDFSAGDRVEMIGERGSFTIKSIRVYDDGTVNYVTLFGGTSGREAWRSCTADRIRYPKRRVRK
jgi:hypothetical protein